MAKVQRVATEILVQEKEAKRELKSDAEVANNNSTGVSPQISSMVVEVRREVAVLQEKARVTDLKIEDYKDELLDRLSLAGSIGSKNTAANSLYNS